MITLAVTGLVAVFLSTLAVAVWAMTEDIMSYKSWGAMWFAAFVSALTFTAGLSVLWLIVWIVARSFTALG